MRIEVALLSFVWKFGDLVTSRCWIRSQPTDPCRPPSRITMMTQYGAVENLVHPEHPTSR